MKLQHLDLRAVLMGVAGPFLFWLLVVAAVTIAGGSGVVCVTPLALLLAIPAAAGTVKRSRSPQPKTRWLEAVLAGAFTGLLEGLLFNIWAVFFLGGSSGWGGRFDTEIIFQLGSIIGSGLAAAALGGFFGWLIIRRNP